MDDIGTSEAAVGVCFDVDSIKNIMSDLWPNSALGNRVPASIAYCPWIPWTCCRLKGESDHSFRLL